MPQSKIEKIKVVFTSEYWLIAALGGAFVTFFALNRGGIIVFIDAGFVLLLINIVAGIYRPPDIPISYWIALGIGGILLLISVLFHPKISHYSWMANLVRMLCVIFAFHCLSLKTKKFWMNVLFLTVPAFAVCWQLYAFYYYKMPFGTYSNPHYLASYAMLVLPILFGAFLVTRGWYRYLFLVIAMLDANLLILIGSRPAITGIAIAVIIVLLFFVRGRIRWIGLALFPVGLLVLYFSQYGDLYMRFYHLIVNLPNEERVQLWFSAWQALQDNSWLDWIFGNGIGGYRQDYFQYTPPEFARYHFFFPHFHILEILYDNGITGVFLVFGGFGALLLLTVKRIRNAAGKNARILVKCLVAVLLGWLIHSGLTFPFYSKYSMYSLAFILGPLLATLEYRTSEENETNKI